MSDGRNAWPGCSAIARREAPRARMQEIARGLISASSVVSMATTRAPSFRAARSRSSAGRTGQARPGRADRSRRPRAAAMDRAPGKPAHRGRWRCRAAPVAECASDPFCSKSPRRPIPADAWSRTHPGLLKALAPGLARRRHHPRHRGRARALGDHVVVEQPSRSEGPACPERCALVPRPRRHLSLTPIRLGGIRLDGTAQLHLSPKARQTVTKDGRTWPAQRSFPSGKPNLVNPWNSTWSSSAAARPACRPPSA